MATDFISVLKEIRGTGAPEAPYTDGIYHDLTIKSHNGNPGVYGDILAKYTGITDTVVATTANVALTNADVVTTNALVAQILNGRTWFIGNGNPTTSGVDGDMAYNTTTTETFKKVTGSWVSQGVLRGMSMYEIAVSNGFVGTEAQWLTSMELASQVGNTTNNTLNNTVGNTVGNTLNNTLGNTVGNTANNTDGNTVGNTFNNTFGNTTGNTLNNTAGNTVGNDVGNTTGNTVGNTTGNTVGNTVGNTTGNTSGNTTGNNPAHTWTGTSLKFTGADGTYTGVTTVDLKGPQGQSVHHESRTSGTGASGTTDVYTLWGDAGETINLGTHSVYNGADGLGSGDMLKATYDTTNNGTVDNAEKVNGLTVQTAVPTGAVFTDTVYVITTDINDITPASNKVYSSTHTQDLHNVQATAIANLATAQAQIANDDTTVITTSDQPLSFSVTIDSTDTNVMTLSAVNDTFTFKKNASYNFTSSIQLASTTGTTRTITFEVYNTADDSVLATQAATLDVQSGSSIVINTVTLITIGRNSFPNAPVTAGVRVRASGTGYSVTGFSSILASSSSYDVSGDASGITVVPVGTIASTNVQAALSELDSEKATTAVATTSTNGLMSSTDKTKIDGISGSNSGDQTITLTGAVTGSGTGSFATTLADFDASKITSGTIDAARLPSYVDDAVEYATKALLPVTGETSKIYIVIADETNGGDTSQYRWTGTVYALVSNTLTATDILNLLVTVDGSGSGLDADTLDGISSAGFQGYDADLSAIASLAGTTGLLKKTAADTWTLDTAAYTTNLGTVTAVTGTAPVVSSGGATPAISMAAATALVNGYMTSTYASKLDGIAVSANNYVLPASVVHDTESGALHATDALRVSGTTLSLYKGDGTFESVTTQDTVYTHPSTDGSLHVPATGTTSNGKVLTAGATAGSMTWATPTSGVTDHTLLSNIGTNTHTQIDTALTRLVNTSGTNTGDQNLSGYSLTSHNHTIDGLSNVVITANSDNEILAWDSATSKWVNQTAAEALLATSIHTHAGTYEPANANIQTHVSSTSNPHSTTAAQVGAMSTSHSANAITGLSISTTSLVSGSTGTQGTSTVIARQDHTHTLPAYPTTLPASDVYAWAKATTKPTYTNTEVGAQASSADLTAIDALVGISGLLKKTATDTWTLDTVAYTTNVGTVTSVTAGNGLTQSGTSTVNPTLDIVSHAGTANSIGTINIGADTIGVNLGTTTTTACSGADSRLTDARTPVAHNQTESTITFTDITTGNASTTAHGYLPKLSNDATMCLTGTGTWASFQAPSSFKAPCRLATTGTVNLGITGVGITIDGVVVALNDRVLIKNNTASANGIYVATAGAWVRATDTDTAEKIAGSTVTILYGTINGGDRYFTEFPASATLGTTSMVWTRDFVASTSTAPLSAIVSQAASFIGYGDYATSYYSANVYGPTAYELSYLLLTHTWGTATAITTNVTTAAAFTANKRYALIMCVGGGGGGEAGIVGVLRNAYGGQCGDIRFSIVDLYQGYSATAAFKYLVTIGAGGAGGTTTTPSGTNGSSTEVNIVLSTDTATVLASIAATGGVSSGIASVGGNANGQASIMTSSMYLDGLLGTGTDSNTSWAGYGGAATFLAIGAAGGNAGTLTAGAAGAANTGAGGGGGALHLNSTRSNGGAGGSGKVLIYYAD